MKTIELTQGRLACVDDEDFKWLSKWNWHYHRVKHANTGYAERTDHSGPEQRIIRMHVAIMKRHKHWKHERQIDHINICGCDNRKENLRLVTSSEQRINRGQRSDNTSGVVGVSWHKARNKWEAYITINKKRIHLGIFPDKDFDEAVKVRLKAEFKYFGEFQHNPTNVCPLGYTGECPDCAQRLKELQDV